MRSIRAIDLFCGIGGNSLGARQVGVEIVAGLDISQRAGEVYRANFPEARFYLGDLSAFRREDILRIKEEIGEIDLLLASPECTSYSPARGGKPPVLKSLRLPWNIWRFARIFRPRWMVIENVPAMRSWSGYPTFLECLRKEGYRLREQILDASQFGVPQRRKRLFVLCDRETEPPEISPVSQEPLPARSFLRLNGTYPVSPLEEAGRARKTLERAERAFESLGRNTPFLMVYYGAGVQWQTLDVPLRTVTTHDRFALILPDGKGKHVMRMLQPDELQAAMGFPPEFSLEACPTRAGKIHLLGNAVCPPVVAAIVQSMCKWYNRDVLS
jgi:DNA (cytosine-5)-methyltransferase 1